MSRENVEIARRHFERAGRVLDDYWADPQTPIIESPSLPPDLFDLVHPDAEWQTPVVRDPVRGPRNWLRAIEDAFEAVDYWRPEIEDLIDLGGDNILATFRVSIRGKGSGVPVTQRIFSVVTLRDRKISRIVEYTDREEALEAVGLSE
jgi:ketosteroid isomerase-like protein